jgi:hypothetical protein
MKRDDIAKNVMPIRLYHLLLDMREDWERWSPMVGWNRRSAFLATGGVVSGCEEFEEAADRYGLEVIGVAWSELARADKAGQIAVEQVLGWLPPVATVREGVLEGAVAFLVAECRRGGVDV